jgi:hypothetical protein
MKTEKNLCEIIKIKSVRFFRIGIPLLLVFFFFSCKETTTENKKFPIDWIKQNSFNRDSYGHSFTNFDKNGKVDLEFVNTWLKDTSISINFCTSKNNDNTDECPYSAHFVDCYDSQDLFFFTIAEKYSPPAGYWNTTFYHFTFDKTKKKVVRRDFLTSIGGTEDGTSSKSDVELLYSSTNESALRVTETNKETLAEIDDYFYDKITVTYKKFTFSKSPTVEELCDSVSYTIKSCN